MRVQHSRLFALTFVVASFGLGGTGCTTKRHAMPPTDAAPNETAPLTNAEIEAVVGTGLGEMRTCFSMLLVNRHGSQGVLTLQWIVQGNGTVEGVVPSHSDFSPGETAQLLDCLAPKVLALPFPRTRGEKSLRITYPFVVK